MLRLTGKFYRYLKNYGLKAALWTAFFYAVLMIDRFLNRHLGSSRSQAFKLNKVLETEQMFVNVIVPVLQKTPVEQIEKTLQAIKNQSFKQIQIDVFEENQKNFQHTPKGDLTWICEPGFVPSKDFLAELVRPMRDESVMWSYGNVEESRSSLFKLPSGLYSQKQFLQLTQADVFPDCFMCASVFRGTWNQKDVESLFYDVTVGGAIHFSDQKKIKYLGLLQSKPESSQLVVRSQKPHIAMCITGFISGGGETFPIRLANSLRRKGYPVTFINFNLYPTNLGIRRMLDKNIPVLNLRSLRTLKPLVEAYGIDIIHSHNATIDVMISESNLDQTQHVVTLHGMYEAKGQEHLSQSIPELFNKVDQWVYTTDKNLGAFKKMNGYDPSHFTKIGNGIEIKAAPIVQPSDFGIPPSSFIVCLASRAIREKGWEEAIEIVGKVRERTQKDVQLVLLGDGPLYQHYKTSAPDYVHCVGFQDNVAGFFAISDVFLFPTTFMGESFPLVILDSLSVGTPIIASDVGEIRKMLTNERGEVSGDIFSLDNQLQVPIDAAVKLLERYVNEENYLQGKSMISLEQVKRFDMRTVVQSYIDVYNKMTLDKKVRS